MLHWCWANIGHVGDELYTPKIGIDPYGRLAAELDRIRGGLTGSEIRSNREKDQTAKRFADTCVEIPVIWSCEKNESVHDMRRAAEFSTGRRSHVTGGHIV